MDLTQTDLPAGKIADNIEKVLKNIETSCAKAGRDPKEVSLIAVSKTKPVEMLQAAYDAGMRDFGENKVQEIMDKMPRLPSDIRWHMIGHLQRNKVKYIIDKVFLIHSVDSLRLAEEISKEAGKHGLIANILVEVNIAGEESKFGAGMDEAAKLVYDIAKLPGICVKGLMTVAPFTECEEDNRKYFSALKQLSVDIAKENNDNINVGNVLSMGMTGDYQTAVEEGATYVRVGTGIFGERSYIKES